MKKLISMAVAIMMLVSTTVTANAATKTRVLVEGNEGRFWQTYLYGEYTSGGESCGHTGIDFISKNSSGAVAPMDVYSPTEFALVRDGQVMSANVEGKILDEHSIDVMSGNYLAAASIDELKRERAQCKVE